MKYDNHSAPLKATAQKVVQDSDSLVNELRERWQPMVNKALESYLESYKEFWPKTDENDNWLEKDNEAGRMEDFMGYLVNTYVSKLYQNESGHHVEFQMRYIELDEGKDNATS